MKLEYTPFIEKEDILSALRSLTGGKFSYFERHTIIQGISSKTARNDLMGLSEKGLISSKIIGNKRFFFPI